MDIQIKWAVMAVLRRNNPALPPRAKAGLAQRRLDTAIKVASDAYFAGFRDWAARVILTPPRGDGRDSLYLHLANRLADIIWNGEEPNWRHVEAWWHLYTLPITTPPYRRGYTPRGWEYIQPDTYHRDRFPIDHLSPFKREWLRCAGEIDNSFQVQTWWKEDKELYDLTRTSYFTTRAIWLINRVTKWNLPISIYRGREYVGGKALPYFALLRLFLLRNRANWALRIARYIGRTFVHRHIPSGHIYGPWIEGRATPGKREPFILSLHVDPVVTEGADYDLTFRATSALEGAIR
jgi:hypothetical protein